MQSASRLQSDRNIHMAGPLAVDVRHGAYAALMEGGIVDVHGPYNGGGEGGEFART